MKINLELEVSIIEAPPPPRNCPDALFLNVGVDMVYGLALSNIQQLNTQKVLGDFK